MQLTVPDLIELFNVAEVTLTRWVRKQELPAQRVAGQFRFNRVEVLDWVVEIRIKLETNLVDYRVDLPLWVGLADSLEAGGVHYQVPGEDRAAAFGAVVARLPLPEDFDRELLLRHFLAREALDSTAVGDRIAIPHVRHPVVLNVLRPVVTLCFLNRPIAYQAADGKPVRILFSVISPTAAAHVEVLARLFRALHDPGFRRSVEGTKPRAAIQGKVRRVERAEQSADRTSPRAA